MYHMDKKKATHLLVADTTRRDSFCIYLFVSEGGLGGGLGVDGGGPQPNRPQPSCRVSGLV